MFQSCVLKPIDTKWHYKLEFGVLRKANRSSWRFSNLSGKFERKQTIFLCISIGLALIWLVSFQLLCWCFLLT